MVLNKDNGPRTEGTGHGGPRPQPDQLSREGRTISQSKYGR